jgi:hypothetical protein
LEAESKNLNIKVLVLKNNMILYVKDSDIPNGKDISEGDRKVSG